MTLFLPLLVLSLSAHALEPVVVDPQLDAAFQQFKKTQTEMRDLAERKRREDAQHELVSNGLRALGFEKADPNYPAGFTTTEAGRHHFVYRVVVDSPMRPTLRLFAYVVDNDKLVYLDNVAVNPRAFDKNGRLVYQEGDLAGRAAGVDWAFGSESRRGSYYASAFEGQALLDYLGRFAPSGRFSPAKLIEDNAQARIWADELASDYAKESADADRLAQMLLERGFARREQYKSSIDEMDQYALNTGEAEIVVRVKSAGFRYIHVFFNYPGVKEAVSSASYKSPTDFLAKTDDLASLMRVAQQLQSR